MKKSNRIQHDEDGPTNSYAEAHSYGLTASTVVTIEIEWREPNTCGTLRQYKYISTYDMNDPGEIAKIVEQSRKVTILNHPPYYYDTIGREGTKRMDEISRRIVEMRPGYPISDIQIGKTINYAG